MRQVVQQYSTGTLEIREVPAPVVMNRTVLISNRASVVSAGTEKMMIDLAKKSIIGKAIARPDLVQRVIDKVKTEGLKEAIDLSISRLDTPVPLGYSCSGEVIDVGDSVDGISVGSRVACLGSGYASHAEIVNMPRNLVSVVPDNVPYEQAAFVGVGAIALHGVRNSEIQIGDRVAIIGLGLLGLIAVQLVTLSGGRVVGLDLNSRKCEIARRLGAEEVLDLGSDDVPVAISEFTDGLGVDKALIFAGTRSNSPIEMAGDIARERGRIVAVGAVGLDIPREVFYHKELSLVVSRSWGPGAEDVRYERQGYDYPPAYVRWTQQRNMEVFLDLVSKGRINLGPIITHRFPFSEALKAYEMITGERKEDYTGIVLSYGSGNSPENSLQLRSSTPTSGLAREVASVGFIGAGQFAKGVLLPTVRKMGNVVLDTICTATGVSSAHSASKFGFRNACTDYRELVKNPNVDAVFISTRHNLHAQMVSEALRAGKHVFVEKPLATSVEEVREVVDSWRECPGVLMVGFNRRWAPLAVRASAYISTERGPMSILCTVNAGSVDPRSWVVDPIEGRGRIVGEVCHFVDLVQYLTNGHIEIVYAEAIADTQDAEWTDVHVELRASEGSVASIVYTSRGHRSFPRERIEVFRGSSVCTIDNFRRLAFYSGHLRKNHRLATVDRGYSAEIEGFFERLRHPARDRQVLDSYINTTLASLAIERSLRTGRRIRVDSGSYAMEEI